MTDMILPEGWVEARLGDIVTWGSGGTPSRKVRSYYNGNIPWVKTGDLGEKFIEKTAERISQEAIDNSNAKIFSKGSVILAMYGATIGKVSILKYEAATNQACAVASLNVFVASLFLYYLLKSDKNAFIAKGKGGAQPNISQTIIKLHLIKLPPIAEQEEIAQRVDRAIGHVDELKSRLETLLTTLKTFRQSVLNAAVTGKLTENWREETTLDSWAQSILSNYIYKPTYGSSQKSQKSGKIPVIRMGNIQNGVIDWDNLVYTSDDEEIKKYSLEFGDVLFNRTNSPELVGKTAIYKGEQKAIYAGYLIKIKCLSNLLPDYLNYSLNSSYAKDYCQKVKSDGVNQSNINAQKLKNYTLLIPPLAEQEEIVKRVEAYFALADQIEKQVQSALDKVNLLTQSILAKAFRGELTKEWRKKNPELISGENSAEALLKRIKAEKDALEKPSKKTKNTKVQTGFFD